MKLWIRQVVLAMGAALLALFAPQGSSTEWDLTDVPLELVEGAAPNLMITLDTSASMGWFVVPLITESNRLPFFDGINSYDNPAEFFNDAAAKGFSIARQSRGRDTELLHAVMVAYTSLHANGLAFDPTLSYQVPVDASGTSLGNSSFNAAWDDGFDQSGSTSDLNSAFVPCNYSDLQLGRQCSAQAAFYHVYDESLCPGAEDSLNADCYLKMPVDAAYKQNFANWYSYYRTRFLAARSAMSLAFSSLDSRVRVAYQNFEPDVEIAPVRPFSLDAGESGNKAQFYQWLSDMSDVLFTGGTPLREFYHRGSDYFTEIGPYLDDPSIGHDAVTNPARSCRRNVHLLFTDGEWGPDGLELLVRNYDSSTDLSLGGSDYSIDTYSAMAPYRDDNQDYLADLAFYYWATDLRPGSDSGNVDDVPDKIVEVDRNGDGQVTEAEIFWNPKNDPARWQHVVTYTIGLGTPGTLADSEYDNLLSGATEWTDDRLDDLWHAAINGRGERFTVNAPDDLLNALTSVVETVAEEGSGAGSLSSNSGSFFNGSKLFQARFNSADWSGDIIAYPLSSGDNSNTCHENPVGTVCSAEWFAAAKLDAASKSPANRQILTFSPDDGAGEFAWSSLNNEQKEWLKNGGSTTDGSNRLDFLRGETVSGLRTRSSRLGEILDSGPLFVGPPSSYIAAVEGESDYYTNYKNNAAYSGRTGMVYAGAGDGMLHAFDADDGDELFAYVPFSVFNRLHHLTDELYSDAHKFYVNGPLVQGDAYFGGAWNTVLLGALGRGGQGQFALNVTQPESVRQNGADNAVLWEFTDRVDRDLGFTYGKAAVARVPTANGTKWAAIFGNGYNNTAVNDEDTAPCLSDPISDDCTISQSGDAALYIVDLVNTNTVDNTDFSSGGWTKVAIPVGSSEDPTGQNRPNGLSSVTAVDTNGNQIVDVIYAGDIFGNVWKVLLDEDSGSATLAFPSNKPLFSAYDGRHITATLPYGSPQPITTKIRVANHPRGVGYLVVFGTGKYLEASDISDDSVQTLYAIWDDGNTHGYPSDGTAASRTANNLLRQQVLAEGSIGSTGQYRVTSNNRIDWSVYKGWYLDLILAGGTAQGERVILDPSIRNNRVMFVSFIPNNDICTSTAGDSWVNVLDINDGSRLDSTAFDTNLDGVFGTSDLVTYTESGVDVQVAAASFKLGSSNVVYSNAASIVSGNDIYNYFSDTAGGAPVTVLESTGLEGRQWQDIR